MEQQQQQQQQQQTTIALPPQKSKVQSALLAFALGTLGVHRFYVGKPGSGAVMLVLSLSFVGLIITAPWALIDFIVILSGGMKDGYGRELV